MSATGMRLRGGTGFVAAASATRLVAGAPNRVLRRGGVAAVIGIAAVRSPDRAVLVREHDTLTGSQLDAALHATAAAVSHRWPAGARVGLRGDGGIDFIIALAGACLAGIDVMPIGPRHGTDDLAALATGLDAVVDAWDVAVRVGDTAAAGRRPGRLLVLSTGTGGVPVATARGRVGARAMLQLADADRRLRMPAGAVLVLAPPDHGHGLSMVLAGLVRGRSVLLASGMRPAEQADFAARHLVGTVTGVPAQLARLVEADPSALGRVRLVVSGSSKLPDALRARLEEHGARVLDCYGTTESGTVAMDGLPLAGVTIEVDDGGRILITSPLGGRRRDSGDRGHVEAGRLVVDGRVGELVDSGGELVSADRVAAVLRTIPGVLTANVTSEPDDLLGSRLCAEVTVSDTSLDAAMLSHELATRLGRAAVPREWVVRTNR
ncbi:hypothetical protein BH09ACT4_BH09ACT4_06900 [soil metagenome]